MPRLLHHHNRLLARPNRRHLRRLLDRALPTDGRQGATNGRVLVPAEVDFEVGDGGVGKEGGGWWVEAVISLPI